MRKKKPKTLRKIPNHTRIIQRTGRLEREKMQIKKIKNIYKQTADGQHEEPAKLSYVLFHVRTSMYIHMYVCKYVCVEVKIIVLTIIRNNLKITASANERHDRTEKQNNNNKSDGTSFKTWL